MSKTSATAQFDARDILTDLVPPAVAAAMIVLGEDDRYIVVVEDEARAEEIARIAAAFAPLATVVYLAASDALPGDVVAATPANIGRRVEALRRLRVATTEAGGAPIIVVLSADASAVRYAAPSAFDEVPPIVRSGDKIDPSAFASRTAEIGYVAEDHVDEPGAIAIRGNMIDIFAADSAMLVRIEFADGIITSLRNYDPLTQITTADVEDFTIGRASERRSARACR